MVQLTDFGRSARKRLIDIGEPQTWLQMEIKKRTGMYVDAGYLYKIFTGQRSPEKVITAIREILELPEEKEDSA